MGEELHPFDSRQKPLKGGGTIFANSVIVKWLDDQAHALGLT